MSRGEWPEGEQSNRGNGSGRGRGRDSRGGSGRGRGRGRGRENNYNKVEQITDVPQFTLMEEDSILSRRRERFLKDQEKIERNKESEFGLICRGEDLRLQQDESSRLKLFDILTKDWEMYKGNPEKYCGKLDVILMNCRKLREAMLSLKVDEFTIKTFLLSTRIGVSVGKYQTYLPSINFLLTKAGVILKAKELVEVQVYYVLHVLHSNNEIERSFQLFFSYFSDYKTSSSAIVKRLYEILVSWSNNDFHKWNQLYQYERENDTLNSNIMKFGHLRMVQLSMEVINKAFFILPKDTVESYTGCSFDVLTSGKYSSCGWAIDAETGVVTIRSRK